MTAANPTPPLTDDELTILIEALREYRLRVEDPPRKLLSEALVYRLGLQLISQVERSRIAP